MAGQQREPAPHSWTAEGTCSPRLDSRGNLLPTAGRQREPAPHGWTTEGTCSPRLDSRGNLLPTAGQQREPAPHSWTTEGTCSLVELLTCVAFSWCGDQVLGNGLQIHHHLGGKVVQCGQVYRQGQLCYNCHQHQGGGGGEGTMFFSFREHSALPQTREQG